MNELLLTVTEQEINILSAALSEMPYRISAPLISKLQGQINDQMRQPEPLPPLVEGH